jgi:septum formation protein
MPKLILASGSSYKRALMARLGLSFESITSEADETSLPGETPPVCAARLAVDKAKVVAAAHPDAWVIGCDQIIARDGLQLHKPGSAEGAIAQLEQLQGRAHDLVCAIAIISPDGAVREASVWYEMHMRPLSRAAIEAYVAEDMPTDCAGSYKLEQGGIRLFASMRGDDYTAIVGLPLTRVWALLQDAGYPLPG